MDMKAFKKDFCFTLVCEGVYILVLWNLIPFVYGIIDDRSMMEIVSGQYLGMPDPHTIFMGYWYSLFLTGLYTVLPNVDWYAFCYIVMQVMCMILILFRLVRERGRKWEKVLCAVLALSSFAAFGVQATVQLSFTTTAAVLGRDGCFSVRDGGEIRVERRGVSFFPAFSDQPGTL